MGCGDSKNVPVSDSVKQISQSDKPIIIVRQASNSQQVALSDLPKTNPMARPLIADSILDVIGATPCVRVHKICHLHNIKADLVLKLESMEPCNSVKDRVGKGFIEYAESRGEITPGETVIVEPTSGNTGIGLAMVAAAKGYQCVLTMPESMSLERRIMLKALGARLVLTPADKGMRGSIVKAQEIVNSLNGKGIMFQQFDNPDNTLVHRETTGPEIWYQCEGKVDCILAGVGTGGTLNGISQYIKSKNPNVKVFAIEPAESAVLSGRPAGPHKIQGIGAGFIPLNCDLSLVDEVIQIPSDDAIAMARQLATMEGVFCGISSGAVVCAAALISSKYDCAGKRMVAVVPDFGERYLSTTLFKEVRDEAEAQLAEPVNLPSTK